MIDVEKIGQKLEKSKSKKHTSEKSENPEKPEKQERKKTVYDILSTPLTKTSKDRDVRTLKISHELKKTFDNQDVDKILRINLWFIVKDKIYIIFNK